LEERLISEINNTPAQLQAVEIPMLIGEVSSDM
jgi:hypothetical protein